MVRITASGSLRAKGRMARIPTTTSSTRIPRRRRACDLPYMRLLTWVDVGSPLPQNGASEIFCLLPEFIQVSVVLYNEVGPPGLLLTRELPRLHGPQRHLIDAPFLRPYEAPLFWHRDGHRIVEVLAPPRLEEQWYLHGECFGPGRLDAPVCFVAHQRMQYLFEVSERLRVGEYFAAEGLAVDALRSSDVFPEAFCNPGYRLAIVLQKVVHDLIGRGRLSVRQLSQKSYQCALARRERAGDGDGHRPSHGPSL